MNGKRAFTLIELLVVISILVLLMALLMPTLQRVRNQARAVACQAKLRQWGIFYSAQLAQGERIMGAHALRVDNAPPPTVLDWWDERERCFGPQVQELSLCPMATRLSDQDIRKSSGGDHAAGSTFAAWWESFDKGKTVASSYGINLAVETVGGTSDWDVVRISSPVTGWWSDSAAGAGRAAIPVMLDCAVWCPGAGRDPPPYQDALAGWFETCINRHDGGINQVFLDWSVRKVGLKELWTLKWWKGFDTRGPWTKAGGVQPEDWPAWMRGFKDY
jgi:prepilin-type N-terminal cleavage/methylation domain-containing protein/prepilin-type processing-associated H-X9-DG protein